MIDTANIQTGSVRATTGRLGWAQEAQIQAAIRPRGAPLGQYASSPLFVNPAGDEMALLIEMVVNLGVDGAPFGVRNHRAGKAGRKQ